LNTPGACRQRRKRCTRATVFLGYSETSIWRLAVREMDFEDLNSCVNFKGGSRNMHGCGETTKGRIHAFLKIAHSLSETKLECQSLNFISQAIQCNEFQGSWGQKRISRRGRVTRGNPTSKKRTQKKKGNKN
jgi:hypothetical protein